MRKGRIYHPSLFYVYGSSVKYGVFQIVMLHLTSFSYVLLRLNVTWFVP